MVKVSCKAAMRPSIRLAETSKQKRERMTARNLPNESNRMMIINKPTIGARIARSVSKLCSMASVTTGSPIIDTLRLPKSMLAISALILIKQIRLTAQLPLNDDMHFLSLK